MAEFVTDGTGNKYGVDQQAGTLINFPWEKLMHGPDDVFTPVTETTGLPVKEERNATAVVARVTASLSNVTVLAASATRHGAIIYNDSADGILKIKFGVTATATDFTVAIFPNGLYHIPVSYSGRIDGLWSVATGAAQVTSW